ADRDRPYAVPRRRPPDRDSRPTADTAAPDRHARRRTASDPAPVRPDRGGRAERRPRPVEPPRIGVLAGRAGVGPGTRRAGRPAWVDPSGRGPRAVPGRDGFVARPRPAA